PRRAEHRHLNLPGMSSAATLDELRSSGGRVGESLADAFQWIPWRKFHWAVRALLENSAVLATRDFSFRRWLQAACVVAGVASFPPSDFKQVVDGLSLEQWLRRR